MNIDEPGIEDEFEITFQVLFDTIDAIDAIDAIDNPFGDPLWAEVGIVRAALTDRNNDGSEIEAGTLMDKYKHIVIAARQFDDERPMRKLVKFSRAARMEFSRFQMEPCALAYNAINIESLEEQIRLHAKSTLLDKFRQNGETVPPELEAKLNENYEKLIAQITACDLDIDQRDMIKAIEDATHDARTELKSFKDWDSDLRYIIAATNNGNHLKIDDVEEATQIDPKVVRFITNLSRIWVQFIDPHFRLPSSGKTNPFVSYILHALNFFEIEGMKRETIVFLATRLIRPAIRKSGVEHYDFMRYPITRRQNMYQ